MTNFYFALHPGADMFALISGHKHLLLRAIITNNIYWQYLLAVFITANPCSEDGLILAAKIIYR
jgi:hypothetical protein